MDQIEQLGDRLQAVLGIERYVPDQELVVDDRIGIDDADGVAVGGRVLAGSGADILHATWTIFDHDGMAEPLAQLLAERAHKDVADATGTRRGERANGPRRPILRACR